MAHTKCRGVKQVKIGAHAKVCRKSSLPSETNAQSGMDAQRKMNAHRERRMRKEKDKCARRKIKADRER
eukprot:6211382-Pleurochrysis_carterae.AAC.6